MKIRGPWATGTRVFLYDIVIILSLWVIGNAYHQHMPILFEKVFDHLLLLTTFPRNLVIALLIDNPSQIPLETEMTIGIATLLLGPLLWSMIGFWIHRLWQRGREQLTEPGASAYRRPAVASAKRATLAKDEMMIRIDYLTNHRPTIPMWTDYFWNEWKTYYLRSHKTQVDVRDSIEERCNIDRLPLAVVALENDTALGTGCLKTMDLDERPALTPWLAGVFVIPSARHRGIGSLIIRHLENEAVRLGHEHLYLWTPTAEDLYTSLGWQVLEHIDHLGQRITIMGKGLTAETAA